MPILPRSGTASHEDTLSYAAVSLPPSKERWRLGGHHRPQRGAASAISSGGTVRCKSRARAEPSDRHEARPPSRAFSHRGYTRRAASQNRAIPRTQMENALCSPVSEIDEDWPSRPWTAAAGRHRGRARLDVSRPPRRPRGRPEEPSSVGVERAACAAIERAGAGRRGGSPRRPLIFAEPWRWRRSGPFGDARVRSAAARPSPKKTGGA